MRVLQMKRYNIINNESTHYCKIISYIFFFFIINKELINSLIKSFYFRIITSRNTDSRFKKSDMIMTLIIRDFCTTNNLLGFMSTSFNYHVKRRFQQCLTVALFIMNDNCLSREEYYEKIFVQLRSIYN